MVRGQEKAQSDKKFKEIIEKLDKLDGTFELLLVLLSIISAALFQYACTIEPLRIASINQNFTQSEFFQEVNGVIKRVLSLFFIPLLILIGIWFVNRLSLKTRIRGRKFASEFCYIMSFAIIMFDVSLLLGVSFSFDVSILSYVFLAVPFCGGLAIVYLYERTFLRSKDFIQILVRLFGQTAVIYFPALLLVLGIMNLCLRGSL